MCSRSVLLFSKMLINMNSIKIPRGAESFLLVVALLGNMLSHHKILHIRIFSHTTTTLRLGAEQLALDQVRQQMVSAGSEDQPSGTMSLARRVMLLML